MLQNSYYKCIQGFKETGNISEQIMIFSKEKETTKKKWMEILEQKNTYCQILKND